MSSDDDRVAYLMGESAEGLDERDQLALDDLRELLADRSVWGEPPAGLEDSVVVAITAEAASGSSDIEPAPRPAPEVEGEAVSLDEARSRRSSPRRWLPAVAAAAVVAGALGIGLAGNGEEPLRFDVVLATVGPGEASGSATLTRTVSGWEVVLEADGLPRLDGGRYYQAWLKDTEGVLVPIGSFNESGRIVLWSGVTPVDFPDLTVTVEAADGNQASSGMRVLAGTVDTSG